MKRILSIYDLTLRDIDRINDRLTKMDDSDLKRKIIRQLAELQLNIIIAKGERNDYTNNPKITEL